MEVRLSGYADDTALYLRSSKEIPEVLRILEEFGIASGLKVNLTKSVVVPLRKGTMVRQDLVSGMQILDNQTNCRYLGIQVGQSTAMYENWDKCIKSLQARLYLAKMKTHSVSQRAAIAHAIIIPKAMYVARHSWPTVAVIDRLHLLIKRFVWGS